MTSSTAVERMHTGARMSKIAKHAGLVYLCGQTSSGSDASSVQEQTQEVLNRVDALLKEAGCGPQPHPERAHPPEVHGRLRCDEPGVGGMVPAGAAPARTTVEARLASDSLKVEITVVAAGG